jgi:hypothetical protein
MSLLCNKDVYNLFHNLINNFFNNFRMMKIQRNIFFAEKSLKHFIDHDFKFVNFDFIDLNLSIPKYEQDDFAINQRTIPNEEMYIKAYTLGLKVMFNETEADFDNAKRRLPFIFFFTRLINVLFIIATCKMCHSIFYKFFSNE